MFLPGKPYLPCLIFIGRTRNLYEWSTFQVLFGINYVVALLSNFKLGWKGWNRRSCLLGLFVSDKEENFK
jgi:hypothetical protein